MTSLKQTLDRKRREIDRTRRETPWLLLLASVLCLATLAFNSYTWFALSRTPDAGPTLVHRSTLDAPLAWTYRTVGQLWASLMGTPNMGVQGAQRDFAQALAEARAVPSMAIESVLRSRESAWARWLGYSHSATLPLFFLWIVLSWLRPVQRRTFGRN